MTKDWTTQDMPSLAGKRAVITGANRGLGLEIAFGLAGAGAQLTLACRDATRADGALAEIRRRVPGAQVEAMTLDLADLSSVRKFAADFAASHDGIDILCNNASAILVPQGRTRDGFETHLGTNHLGHFALTGLLLPRLRGDARVVNISSMSHKMTSGIDFDDPNVERVAYKPMDAYGRSKQAALLFTFELNRRLQLAGSKIIAVCAHPGWSNSNPETGGFFMRAMNKLMAQSVADGALPALYAASARDVQGGAFYGPGGFQQLRGAPVRVDCRADARDPRRAAQLWSLSEKMTGVRFLD